jgi:hypothetical protein
MNTNKECEKIIRTTEYGKDIVTYPNGLSRTANIDFLSYNENRFVFGKTKKINDSKIKLSWEEFLSCQELNRQLSSRIGYIIGYDTPFETSSKDYLYAITWDELKFKTIWREPDGVYIPIKRMSLLQRRDINNEVNSFLNKIPQ